MLGILVYVCQHNKECGFDEYLKNCICIKKTFGNLAIVCGEVVNESKIVLIIINKPDYCIICTILLAIICLLLLIIIPIYQLL